MNKDGPKPIFAAAAQEQTAQKLPLSILCYCRFELTSLKSGQKLLYLKRGLVHMATISRENIIAIASLAARAMNPSGEGQHCWQALTE